MAKPIRIAELVAALKRAAPASPRGASPKPPAPAALKPAEVAPPIEREAFESLRRVMGEPAALEELVSDFLESARRGVEEMRAALLRGDARALSRGAHALKGMSTTCGAFALGQRCEEVSQGAKGGIDPEVERRFVALVAEHERVAAWLRADVLSAG